MSDEEDFHLQKSPEPSGQGLIEHRRKMLLRNGYPANIGRRPLKKEGNNEIIQKD